MYYYNYLLQDHQYNAENGMDPTSVCPLAIVYAQRIGTR